MSVSPRLHADEVDIDDALVHRLLLAEVWDDALAAPQWDGRPVWLHVDLIPGNLIVRDGRLAAAIDFGTMATGDPPTT